MMTVKEVSNLTGVSIRTLQYYDKIGLLHPAHRTQAGYRLYDDAALERLQQILLFRELEFSLEDIRKILKNPEFDREKALEQQITLLTLKKQHLEKLIALAGKKLLFMGQEFAQLREWSEERELDWFLLDNPDHKHIQNWVKKLLHIYRKNPALYELDSSWGGFEWINANDADRSIYSFIRKSKDGKNQLLFVCSFTPVARPDYRVGVPAKKTYKLILDSDSEEFGGCGRQRPQSYKAVEAECDGRPYSIAYPLEPYGVAVFRY